MLPMSGAGTATSVAKFLDEDFVKLDVTADRISLYSPSAFHVKCGKMRHGLDMTLAPLHSSLY